jgi:hypothetical protein
MKLDNTPNGRILRSDMKQSDNGESVTRARIKELLSQAWTPRAIAAELGISTQAVYQHMEFERKKAEREASA